ncbi:MAG: RNA pseudouridine synthase, partial [Candidatus Magasanikbacteria bacterium]
SEQIREHQVSKIYHALVEGEPKKPKTTLVNWLVKDGNKNFVTVYDSARPNAQYAELDYEVEKSNEKNSILKITLKTGRSHQIRSQLAHLGHPIVGDTKYGSKTPYETGAIALCATALTFQTATTGDIKTATVTPPFSL